VLRGVFVTRYVWDEEGEGRVVGWDGMGWDGGERGRERREGEQGRGGREGRGSGEGVVR
jgi:hypothetical protein